MTCMFTNVIHFEIFLLIKNFLQFSVDVLNSLYCMIISILVKFWRPVWHILVNSSVCFTLFIHYLPEDCNTVVRYCWLQFSIFDLVLSTVIETYNVKLFIFHQGFVSIYAFKFLISFLCNSWNFLITSLITKLIFFDFNNQITNNNQMTFCNFWINYCIIEI